MSIRWTAPVSYTHLDVYKRQVLIPARGILRLLLFLVPYLLAGGDVLWRALRNILRGQVFDENFLMAVATIGAFCIGEYPEAVLVMVFYQVGEWFQGYAVGRSRCLLYTSPLSPF